MCFRQSIVKQILLLYIALLFSSCALAMTVENQRKFFKFLEQDMCPYIKPIEDQGSPMVVNIDVILFSLLSYDDTTGTLNALVMVHLEWKDEFIANGNFSFGESDSISIPLQFLWHPKIFLVNTKTEHTVLQTGESNFKTAFLYGILRFIEIGLSVTNCEADSFYFPMDEHKCELNFTAEETKDKIMLNRSNLLPYDIELSNNNVNWEVNSVSSETIYGLNYTFIAVLFKISRRPLHLFINL